MKEDLKETIKETTKVATAKAEATAAKAKTTASKTAAKAKTTASKTAAKAKTTASKTAAKAVAKTVALRSNTIIQYQDKEVEIDKVEERVKAAFVAEGHKADTIKKINVYVKPEEYSAYYVINDKFSGRVDLF